MVTASWMFFSACEWGQYAANCAVRFELPAKACLGCARVFVAPWLRHRHREGISASLVSENLDQLPSFHGGRRSHPGWRLRWSFTTSMCALMKSSFLLRVEQKTPRNVVKASGRCVLFHSSLNGGSCPWCFGSCPWCASQLTHCEARHQVFPHRYVLCSRCWFPDSFAPVVVCVLVLPLGVERRALHTLSPG